VESTHTVVARFEQQDDAREAILDLELKGIDADAIHLVEIGRRLARYRASGAVLGALAGAAVMILVLVAVGVRPLSTSLLVGLVAGAAGGSFIGGFWDVAKHLPVNEEVFDTHVVDLRDQGDGIVVEVTVDDPRVAADAAAVMRRHHAQQIDREAR
jgi:hypothetical protein